MAYSKAKLKSSGDKASLYFIPVWIGNLSDKCLPIRTLMYVSFKHILIIYFRVLHPVARNIKLETCREYKGHIIKYFVNCCEKEGIIIYSLTF
jgi:hypothetical protein